MGMSTRPLLSGTVFGLSQMHQKPKKGVHSVIAPAHANTRVLYQRVLR
jgi:hypothetical protein